MPEGPPYFQVIEGDLIMSPSPNTFHQIIAGRVFHKLSSFVERKPLGVVLIAPLDVYLTEVNIYQPDVIFVSNPRRAIIGEHGIEGAPDLVVEILSMGTARYDKGSKRKIYARTGVSELWLVDPQARSVQVYQLDKDPQKPVATHGENAVLSSPLLPGLKIRLSEIFSHPA
jgi:Uma2 family endonuclease